MPNALWFTYKNLKSCKPYQKQNKKSQNAKSIVDKLKTKGLMFFVSFFHVICKISNFNMWTAKRLAQASCTDLTLTTFFNFNSFIFKIGKIFGRKILFLGMKMASILNWKNTGLSYCSWLENPNQNSADFLYLYVEKVTICFFYIRKDSKWLAVKEYIRLALISLLTIPSITLR